MSREMLQPPVIIDSTFREGAQAPDLFDARKYYLRTDDKVAITKALILIGVTHIEVFSPSVSPREAEDLQAILALRNELHREGKPYANIIAHVRCDAKDAQEALKAGVDGLHFYIGTSSESQEHKFSRRKTIDQITATALDAIRNVRQDNPDILIRFSGEDAFRTSTEQLFIPYDAVSQYVDRFGLPDTVGTATPETVKKKVKEVKKRFPNHGLEAHFHDDELNAVNNAVVAFFSGVRFIDTTPNGLGERTGITDMGSFFFRLYKKDPSLLAGYDISQMYALNALVADATGTRVKGIVNSYNRTHAAGVHSAAVLRSNSTYEGNPLLEKFGVSQTKLLIGPLSGRHIVDYCLREYLDFPNVTEDQSREVAEIFKFTVHSVLEGNPNMRPMDVLREIAISRGLYFSSKTEKTQRELILE